VGRGAVRRYRRGGASGAPPPARRGYRWGGAPEGDTGGEGLGTGEGVLVKVGELGAERRSLHTGDTGGEGRRKEIPAGRGWVPVKVSLSKLGNWERSAAACTQRIPFAWWTSAKRPVYIYIYIYICIYIYIYIDS